MNEEAQTKGPARSANAKQVKEEPELGTGFPQELHDRSRAKGSELHKTVLAFCSATLGIYFLALTGEVKPALTRSQRSAAICGLVLMAISCFSGVAGMMADSRRNYYWACALQAVQDKSRRRNMYRIRDRWWQAERILDRTLIIGFVIGVLSSAFYMILRVLAR